MEASTTSMKVFRERRKSINRDLICSTKSHLSSSYHTWFEEEPQLLWHKAEALIKRGSEITLHLCSDDKSNDKATKTAAMNYSNYTLFFAFEHMHMIWNEAMIWAWNFIVVVVWWVTSDDCASKKSKIKK